MNVSESHLLSEARRKIAEIEKGAAQAAMLEAARATRPGLNERLAQLLVVLSTKISPEVEAHLSPAPEHYA